MDTADKFIGYYFGFIGFTNISILVATTFSLSFFVTIPQYWLQLWTESNGKSNTFYILGFLFLSSMSWLSTSAQMW
jgi:ATP-binding cassette subfamily C (CFTR/MRP) protein 1